MFQLLQSLPYSVQNVSMVLQVIFIDPRFATAASIIRYGNLMLAQAAMETLR